MKFGQVENPGDLMLTLPDDHPDTQNTLSKTKKKKELSVLVGCAKWNKTDLKNFYPKGTKDELPYYASQFNAIELNATFYKMPTDKQVREWHNKTPDHFRFFPKLTNSISHYRRLINVKELVDQFCNTVANLEKKLGCVFLQMHDNFKPKDMDRVIQFVEDFPKGIPLAIEVRNSEWNQNTEISNHLYRVLSKNKIASIIVDSAGRRDLLHMRLSNKRGFIRFVGANHPTDYKRLDEWVVRITEWKKQGLEELDFFVHQNVELESPLLSAYFIEKLNKSTDLKIKIPATLVK